MDFSKLTPGDNIPKEINVIVEIPAQSGPVKYEVDKETGMLHVDRFMATAMYYPCNYGYLPHSLSKDGDPCDVLVVTPFPLISGAMIASRPVGLLKMTDESGEDNKVIALPADHISAEYRDIQEARQLSHVLLEAIEHFFRHYKDLEPNKWVKVEGWGNAEEARQEIIQSVQFYQDNH